MDFNLLYSDMFNQILNRTEIRQKQNFDMEYLPINKMRSYAQHLNVSNTFNIIGN